MCGETREAAGIVVDARAYDVEGDGQPDNTDALQRALDACAEEGGGIVRLRAGVYEIRGTLSIPSGVTLEGVFCAPSSWRENETNGTTLHAYAGRGSEDGEPFIKLNTNATLKGVAVFYPEQTGAEVVSYPWCVSGAGADDVSIMDCLLLNPYQAIDLASARNERHFVGRVYGSPLRRGIFVDKCTDIGRIENVHFWPFFKAVMKNPAMRAFVEGNAEAFIFGRTDWQYCFNTFCWGYKTGYRFTHTERGVCNGNFTGIGADACNTAVLVENSAPYGILITNGQFVALLGEEPIQIRVEPTHAGTIQFNNCSFWGLSHQNARIAGKGFVSFNQCHFLDWRSMDPPKAAIQVESGLVTVNACRFGKGGPAVRIHKNVRGAIVNANMFADEGAVEVEDGATASVGCNLTAAPRFETPQGARIVDVSSSYVLTEGFWPNLALRDSFNGHSYASWHKSEFSQFRWRIPKDVAGRHTISVWLPTVKAKFRQYLAAEAKYRVHHAAGDNEVTLSQRDHAEGCWAPLGQFDLDESSHVTVDNKADGGIIVDALMLTKTTGD
ncbi:MAG TPA: hypothetical protein HPP77_10955 [Candidatus Hydrogenedentes bacterium]|nr:hypothetical protein [Candidatus Hydrogenedentota bacterium]HIJ72786.1 hypothetical protein [Candidatus Hydrogenedentota bacterium]